MQPDESVDHVHRGITPEDSCQPADELADLELIGDDDAVVVAVFVGVAACFADEIRNVECDKRPAASDSEVELLTIGRLRMPGLIRGEHVESPLSEDPRDDRMNVGVEIDRKRHLAATPYAARWASASSLDITGRPPYRRLLILTDGTVDQRTMIMIKGQRAVNLGERQIWPSFNHLFRRHAQAVDLRNYGTHGEARADDDRLATTDTWSTLHVGMVTPSLAHHGDTVSELTRAQIALAARLMVRARRAALKKKAMTPWAVAVRRICLSTIPTSETCEVMPMMNEK